MGFRVRLLGCFQGRFLGTQTLDLGGVRIDLNDDLGRILDEPRPGATRLHHGAHADQPGKQDAAHNGEVLEQAWHQARHGGVPWRGIPTRMFARRSIGTPAFLPAVGRSWVK